MGFKNSSLWWFNQYCKSLYPSLGAKNSFDSILSSFEVEVEMMIPFGMVT